MPVTIKHGRLNDVDVSDNLVMLYPETAAADVVVNGPVNSNIPANTTNMNALITLVN